MQRRSFLQLVTADAVAAAYRPLYGAAASYRVGIGASSDGYTGAQRAIAASGEFPAARIAGKTVLIKPNLVAAVASNTGTTTDPQVVRAVVDQALAAGAAQVLIVEGAPGANPTPFDACGYSFFNTYNSRVQLRDCVNVPIALATVPNGLAFQQLWVPSLLLDPNSIFISVAKLKTHVNAAATLSMKNLFGFPVPTKYASAGLLPRWDAHARGVDLSIIDLNVVRPIDYAVIDGIWGMEGNGPTRGTPKAMNQVVAGLNPVAVDRVGLKIMGLSESLVPHMAYAASKNLGPPDLSTTTITGDTLTTSPFTPATTGPIVWHPTAYPGTVSLQGLHQTTVFYKIPAGCITRMEIVSDSDSQPGMSLVRTLRDWTARTAGVDSAVWDCRDGLGRLVAPGTYLARVMGLYSSSTPVTFSVGWITVTA